MEVSDDMESLTDAERIQLREKNKLTAKNKNFQKMFDPEGKLRNQPLIPEAEEIVNELLEK